MFQFSSLKNVRECQNSCFFKNLVANKRTNNYFGTSSKVAHSFPKCEVDDVDVKVTSLSFSKKAFIPKFFASFNVYLLVFFCMLMSAKTTQTSTHPKILQMGKNMIKGAKVKVLFQRFHVTCVISMLVYNFKFYILNI